MRSLAVESLLRTSTNPSSSMWRAYRLRSGEGSGFFVACALAPAHHGDLAVRDLEGFGLASFHKEASKHWRANYLDRVKGAGGGIVTAHAVTSRWAAAEVAYARKYGVKPQVGVPPHSGPQDS